jgi:AraC family transcriptional regulator of adaptative response/methylated-DNA-[protein]-cysteine methyltransferase
MMATRDADRIRHAIEFLDQHAQRQPSLDEVAREVGLSPYHFQRLFKRWAGVSPKRFLQFLTVARAKEALREGKSALEASYDSGLSGPGRLHDLFIAAEAVTPGEYKDEGAGVDIRYGFHPTPFGDCLLALTDRGICGLAFAADDAERQIVLDELRQRWGAAAINRDQAATAETAGQLFERPRGAPITLALKGTNFQIKVWEALLRIPPGTVVSYGDIARAIGHPDSYRAVGTAVGRNPIAYIIPCHRVIQSSGAFGNYRWGAARKRAMLGWEAAARGVVEDDSLTPAGTAR